jgi:hypothetical protein
MASSRAFVEDAKVGAASSTKDENVLVKTFHTSLKSFPRKKSNVREFRERRVSFLFD